MQYFYALTSVINVERNAAKMRRILPIRHAIAVKLPAVFIP
jgi:hypothetical protein